MTIVPDKILLFFWKFKFSLMCVFATWVKSSLYPKNSMKDLSASIVVYKSSVEILEKTIQSFLGSTLDSKLYIIDNSPTDRLKAVVNDPRIIYRFNNRNLGFGAGHNTILREILNESKYHIILNPDVYFDEGVIPKLYRFMDEHS